MVEEDIEFLPDDEVEIDDEVAGAENDAVHVEAEQPEQARPEQARPEDADEVEEADAAEEADVEPADEHEEDLEEIIHRHYGIVEEPAAAEPRDDEPRELGPDEFVCQSCFTRRSTAQLADPVHGTCADCSAGA